MNIFFGIQVAQYRKYDSVTQIFMAGSAGKSVVVVYRKHIRIRFYLQLFILEEKMIAYTYKRELHQRALR